MNPNAMKNIIILKDLPSNMIEEAFVVFKDNVKIHKIEKIEKNKKNEKNNYKDYIIKEAEMVINDYISKVEQKEFELTSGNKNLKEKYKRLKAVTIFFAILSAVSVVSIIL